MADKRLRAEVKARVRALAHNASGLRGAAAVAGVTLITLWAWRQGIRCPQEARLHRLRELTS